MRLDATTSVLVVGAGPAGTVAALELARAGVPVMLLERGPTKTAPPVSLGESLPPAARPILMRLGVWDRLVADGHLVCPGTLSAWGSARLTAVDFIADPNGHGFHLDRPVFDRMLRDAAAAAGAELIEGAELRGLVREGARLRATFAAGPRELTITAERIFDCSGRTSVAARRLGAKRHAEDDLLAFATTWIPAPGDRDARGLLESARDGYWYTTLIPGGARVVVCFTAATSETVARVRTPEGFLQLLAETRHVHAITRGAGARLDAGPRARSARTERLVPLHGDGWLAAGDAAMSCDPLASQGILAALHAGASAAREPTTHAYAELAAARHDKTLRNRARYYALERRFLERPFWASRSLPVAASRGRVG